MDIKCPQCYGIGIHNDSLQYWNCPVCGGYGWISEEEYDKYFKGGDNNAGKEKDK